MQFAIFFEILVLEAISIIFLEIHVDLLCVFFQCRGITYLQDIAVFVCTSIIANLGPRLLKKKCHVSFLEIWVTCFF